jgi:hypothetical protein
MSPLVTGKVNLKVVGSILHVGYSHHRALIHSSALTTKVHTSINVDHVDVEIRDGTTLIAEKIVDLLVLSPQPLNGIQACRDAEF